MNKSDLNEIVERKFYLKTGCIVKDVTKTITDQISSAMEQGRRVEVRGLGAWVVKHIPARIKESQFPNMIGVKFNLARKRIKFRATKNLRNMLYEEKEEVIAVFPSEPEPLIESDEKLKDSIDKIKDDKKEDVKDD